MNRGRRLGTAGLALVVGGLVAGCGNHEERKCFCDSPPAVTIRAPAGAVAAVKLGGAACADALPSCFGTSADLAYPQGCAETQLYARHAGACEVEVDFLDGRVFHSTVALVLRDSCCGTVGAATPDGGAIRVP